LFTTSAFAQAAGAAPASSTDMLMQFAPFIAIFAIMYFLILRPQQRRAKDQKALVQGARRGDTVVTSGGLIGKVTKSTDENEVELEIAPNVRVRLARSGIADVRAKGEPVKSEPAKELPAKKDASTADARRRRRGGNLNQCSVLQPGRSPRSWRWCSARRC
jgi:preprotein translocase subunit YajC